jgi:hypothetical protein
MKVIYCLEIGFDNVSESEIERIRQFTMLTLKMNLTQNEINELGPKFQEKYKIKDEEINKLSDL